MRDAAERLARKGLRLLPIHWPVDGGCSCRKANCSSPAKHPVAQLVPHGLKDATANVGTVGDWFNVFKAANVAVATGAESGVVVLDVDPKHGGTESLERLLKQHGDFRATLTARTGSGGLHFYFRHPGYPVRNSAGALGPGLDVRGDGGYVVAPPSKHISGGSYQWVQEGAPILPMPHWLAAPPASVSAQREANAQVGREVGAVVPKGKQHHTLVSVAGTLRRRGLPENVIFATLWEMNTTMLEEPAPRAHIERIARDAAQWEPAEALDLAAELGEPDVEEGLTMLGDEMMAEVERLAAIIDGREQPNALRTGLTALDIATGGLHPGEMTAIAARPSHGKTAMALTIALNLARAGRAVGVFSLEMSRLALSRRLLASESGVDGMSFRRGTVTADDFPHLVQAAGKLYKLPLYVSDRTNLTVPRMLRMLDATEVEPEVLFVDYLQLVQGYNANGRRFNREDEEIAAVSRDLKAVAKERRIPVVVLVQLNRNLEKRAPHERRPALPDLRGSGQIEQDLDVAIGLWRPERYEVTRLLRGDGDVNTAGLAEVAIIKQRDGGLDDFFVRFDDRTATFYDFDKGPRRPHISGDGAADDVEAPF